MISYHPDQSWQNWAYKSGWKEARLRDLNRIAIGINTYAWSPCLWQDGERLQENFKEATYAVLDFDDGDVTVADAMRSFCDQNHIIGTTRSHQKEKNGKPACDRFRLLLEFTEPITDKRTYRYQMHHLVNMFNSDKACVDAARFFWPCESIVSIVTDGFYLDNFPVPTEFENPEHIALRKRVDKYKWEQHGQLDRHLDRFLTEGVTFGSGRNESCFITALKLKDLGITRTEIMAALEQSPFSRQGFRESELKAAVDSAFKK